jgi:hypothetical protein
MLCLVSKHLLRSPFAAQKRLALFTDIDSLVRIPLIVITESGGS